MANEPTANNATPAAAAPAAAAPAAAAPAAAAPAAAAPAAAAPASTTPTPAEPATPVETQTPAAAQGAPEKYEFKPVGELVLIEPVRVKYEEVAKKHNFTQETAQSILDEVLPEFAKAQEAEVMQTRADWAAASLADKEFGGVKYEANMAVVAKSLAQFGTPELTQFLNETGLIKHPELTRAFYRAGLQITEALPTGGGQGQPAVKKSAASILYNPIPAKA